ncbi:MAG: lamin tail domain-containing protein, partial [Chitinivibrionales bacterium]
MRFIIYLLLFSAYGVCALLLGSCENVSPKEPGGTDLQQLRDNLKITEIHYHPFDSFEISGKEFEFIELKNVGSKKLDLSDVAFTDGIDYTFPSGAAVEPGAFIVLASNE